MLDVYASGMGNGSLKEKLHKMLKNNHLETFYNKRLKIKRESSLSLDTLESLIGIPLSHPKADSREGYHSSASFLKEPQVPSIYFYTNELRNNCPDFSDFKPLKSINTR